jgi:hypothetical protein
MSRRSPHYPVREFPILYKGYWIEKNPMTGQMWVEKQGHHIGYCSSVEHGKQIINELVAL